VSQSATNGHTSKKRKGRGGRKSRLTDITFIKQVERLAAKGMTQRQIAVILGIDPCTISSWKSRKGELEDKFNKALKRGEAKGVQRRLDRIEKAGKGGSWQADAWMLERRLPEQFGRNDRMRVSDVDGNPIAGTTVIAPTVVFIQPKKDELSEPIEVGQIENGHPSS